MRRTRPGKRVPQIRRALVGWSGSNADKQHIESIAKWMNDRYPEEAFSIQRTFDTKFNLVYAGKPTDEYGCDFLADTRTFDIVVLHHIFAGWGDGPRPEIADHWFFALSPQHSPEQWQSRLLATTARRIFAFGSTTEVANQYLLEIPGYLRVTTPFGVVFERQVERA
jgi:hypothetical protein